MLPGKLKNILKWSERETEKETNVKRGWWGMHPVLLDPCFLVETL